MLILPSVRQLNYFIALADTLSFSKAAENCFVTQSTLSASIKDLENILGQTLFERNSRQVLLTPQGQVLLERAQNIMNNLQNLVLSASRNKSPLSGNLRLGVIPTIAPYLLPQLFKKLENSYSDLDLSVEENLTHIILERLELGRIDIALLAFPCQCQQYKRRILSEDHLMVAVNKATHTNSKTFKIEDIDQNNLLLLEEGHCLRDQILQTCQFNANEINKKLKASTLDTLLRMVGEGLGTTLIPEMAVKSGLFTKNNLKFIAFNKSDNQPKRQIGLVWRKSSAQENDFQLFGDVIKQLL